MLNMICMLTCVVEDPLVLVASLITRQRHDNYRLIVVCSRVLVDYECVIYL